MLCSVITVIIVIGPLLLLLSLLYCMCLVLRSVIIVGSVLSVVLSYHCYHHYKDCAQCCALLSLL